MRRSSIPLLLLALFFFFFSSLSFSSSSSTSSSSSSSENHIYNHNYQNAISTGVFFQISDAHVDPEYRVDGDAYQRCVNYSSMALQVGGIWGNYNCDTSMQMYVSLLEAMKQTQPNPDWIFYTGDSVPHWLGITNVEFYDALQVKNGIQEVLSTLVDVFGNNVTIYPALGNHDNYLSDQIAPPPKSADWLEFIAETWEALGTLPQSALETVRYGGYYTLLIQPGVRLISFNSIFCDTSNLYAVLNQTDHAGQFVWMENVLSQARQNQEKVYIIGHIVPTDYFEYCKVKYADLAVSYSDVILGHFYGDRHTDEIRIFYDNSTGVNVPAGILYDMPSVDPQYLQNPAYRLFQYSSDGTLQDAITYYAPLGDGNQEFLDWQMEYSVKSNYSLPDLSPASWDGFYQRVLNETEYQRLYIQHLYSNDLDAATECLATEGCADSITSVIPYVSDGVRSSTWTSSPNSAPASRRLLERLIVVPDTLNFLPIGKTQDDSLCDACRAGMKVVDELLAAKVATPLIMDAVIDIGCPYVVPKKFPHQVCVGFVHLYGPYALPVFAEEEDPTVVCDLIGVCDPSL